MKQDGLIGWIKLSLGPNTVSGGHGIGWISSIMLKLTDTTRTHPVKMPGPIGII